MSKSAMFDFLFGGSSADLWTGPVGCRGKAESLLTNVPCALELVFCLKKFKWTPRQGAALDSFMKELKNVAGDEGVKRSDMAEAIGVHLENLNRVINAAGEANPSEGGGRGGSSTQPSVPSTPSGGGTHTSVSGTSSSLGGANQPAGEVPDIREISPREEETFVALFGVIQATPRKIKRVVNLCVC